MSIVFIKPAPVTDADKADKTKHLITAGLNVNLQSLSEEIDYLFNLVWRNPMGLTAQQVLDSFGTSAVSLFVYMNAIQTALNTIQPGICPQVPLQAFTMNQDGTVTITGASP